MDHLHEAICPSCGQKDSMALEVHQASHDPQFIDIIVKCCCCGVVLNEFINIDEMSMCSE